MPVADVAVEAAMLARAVGEDSLGGGCGKDVVVVAEKRAWHTHARARSFAIICPWSESGLR